MIDWTPSERRILKRLDSPAKIQDFLEKIPANFEKKGDTCLSPRMLMKERRAHCIEGALFAAAALRFHGKPAIVMDLTSDKGDDDHVVALFKVGKFYGAISKTNHAVLRYREPIYKTTRELALSYFHEYFLDDGRKTLRSFAVVDLRRFDHLHWETLEKDLWEIYRYLFKVKHTPLLSKKQIAQLRLADPIERKAGKLIEWKK